MTALWPRLTPSVAVAMFAEAQSGALQPLDRHPAQIFAPVGGQRVSTDEVTSLAIAVRNVATDHGYPTRTDASSRISFDRAAAPLLGDRMDLSWSEASSRDVWSFLALVALPDVTAWRFGTDNVERWVATDPNRHTWSRLWWHSAVFTGEYKLLNALSESDLNQLFERRRIGGDPRLARAIAKAVIHGTPNGDMRREVIRDSTARLRRRLAWTDMNALDDEVLNRLMQSIVAESFGRLSPSWRA